MARLFQDKAISNLSSDKIYQLPSHKLKRPMCSQSFAIRQLRHLDIDLVVSLLSQHFISGSVLHQALSVSSVSWGNTIQPDIEKAARSNCSVVAFDRYTDTLLGCAVAWDAVYTKPKPAPHQPVGPLNALLSTLRSGVPVPERGHCVHVDMAVVAPAAQGQGLYTCMRMAVHELSRPLGYTRIRGELSSAATQHVCCSRMGQAVISEVRYRDFKHNNTYPFASITIPPSIQLVEGTL